MSEESSTEPDNPQWSPVNNLFPPEFFQEQPTTRNVRIVLPDLDTLGITELAPVVNVEAKSDGKNLQITVVPTGSARSPQEYDAIIHLMSTAL